MSLKTPLDNRLSLSESWEAALNITVMVEKPFTCCAIRLVLHSTSIYSSVLFFPSHLSWKMQPWYTNQHKYLIHSDCDENVNLLASVCGDSQAIGHKACCFVLLHQSHRNDRDSHLQKTGKCIKITSWEDTPFFLAFQMIYMKSKAVKTKKDYSIPQSTVAGKTSTEIHLGKAPGENH